MNLCVNLIVLILIINQTNGYNIDCLKNTQTCIIKDIKDSLELQELLINKTTKALKISQLSFENCTPEFLHRSILSTFPDLLTLNVSGSQLKSFGGTEINSAHQLESFDLSNNKLTDFNTKLLFKLPNLTTLDVSRNEIEDFDFQALKENNNDLEELNLSRNKLKSVIISENIVKFDASNNLLEHLEIDTNSKLKELDLSGNKLSRNVISNFEHLKSIEHLNIGDIMLEPLKIDMFVHMEHLEFLELRNTGITKIQYGTFSNLGVLEELDISYNKITYLDLNMLRVLRSLTTLHISGNNLVTIDSFENFKKVLPRLAVIGIEQNNWDCLFLSTFHSFLNTQGIKVHKLQYPIKDSTNVMFIQCYQQELTTKMSLITDDLDSEMNKQRSQIIQNYYYNDSSFYKVIASIAITLVVVCILLKLKKYLKFNFFQTYKFDKKNERQSLSIEMEQKGIEVY